MLITFENFQAMGNEALSAIKADTLTEISSEHTNATLANSPSMNTDTKPEEKKLSPCCVCKETKRERDTW